jgi:uncharacterized protein (TIGR02453 family)
MREIIEFLSELHDNNNREWFERNKPRYKSVLAKHNKNVERLIELIASFDSSIEGLKVCDSTYRIYRDTRFSADKTPYKDFMSTFIVRGGKRSGYAGYYLHISPKGHTWGEGSFLAAGNVCPEPYVLRSMREEIEDNAAEMVRNIEHSGFVLDTSNALKRTPRGFSVAPEYEHLLRQRELILSRPIDNDWLLAPDWLERTAEQFRQAKPFIDQVNRAIEYAYEEERYKE